MKRTALLGATMSLILTAAVPASVAAQPGHDTRSNSSDAAAIAALIALGVGIAAAKHANKHSGSNWNNNQHGQAFSPSPQVTCLPAPRTCYERGHVSWRWTRRIFG
jgi:hypothetical protein